MAYKSKYEEQLANALGRITNRKKFNYDFNADPMYQQYKDQYTKLGNEAAANAAANVSALTGGYGNSYAATAAAQANQQYLTKLNEMIPSLQQQALNKYMMEGDELNNTYQTLSDADSRDYSQYRDDVADEQWQKNYDQNLKAFEESIRQYNQNYAYNQARDAIADKQWQAQFDENKRRYDQEWAASQAAQAAAQALLNSQSYSGSSGGSSGGSRIVSGGGDGNTSTTEDKTKAYRAAVTIGTTGSTAATGSNIKSSSPMLYDGTTTQTVKKATDTQNLEATAAKNKAKADQVAYNNTVNSTANAIKQMMNNGTTEANVNRAILSAIVSANDNGYIDMNKDAEKMEQAIRAKVNKLK